MASIGDLANNGGDVLGRLAKLERELRELRAERKVQSSAIGPGRVYTDSVATFEGTSSLTYTDLPSGPGPVLLNVPVSSSGRILLMLSARIGWTMNPAGAVGGSMSIEMSGANTFTPDESLSCRSYQEIGGVGFNVSTGTYAMHREIEGLNEGPTTFLCKYAADIAGTPDFANRTITVWVL